MRQTTEAVRQTLLIPTLKTRLAMRVGFSVCRERDRKRCACALWGDDCWPIVHWCWELCPAVGRQGKHKAQLNPGWLVLAARIGDPAVRNRGTHRRVPLPTTTLQPVIRQPF